MLFTHWTGDDDDDEDDEQVCQRLQQMLCYCLKMLLIRWAKVAQTV